MVDIDVANDFNDSVWLLLEAPEKRVTQGDLFYFEDAEPTRRYGIVVTADCDLENRKHSRLVSLVPLLDLESILSSCLYIDYLEKNRSQIGKFLGDILKISWQSAGPSFDAGVEAVMRESYDVEDYIKEAADVYLNKADSVSKSAFIKIIESLGHQPKNAYSKFEQQVRSRGDIMLLDRPALVFDDVKIVWLRQIWQVSLGSLALRNSRYKAGSGHGQHVARLASPFKYRLTQQFGQVFSDIGGPDICCEWLGPKMKEQHNER